MDPITLGSLGIVFMFVLIALHVPIGIAMAVAGFFGLWTMIGIEGATNIFATTPTDLLVHQSLAAIPMFLLMGSFASAAGLSGDLYRLFHGFVGHYRGGLAMATVAGCGGFGAVCGSSIATASTFMRVALPEMLDRKYKPSLAIGCIAAGGTLGILIPPSNLMLLYGVLTEQFVIALFTAAIIPGLISIAIYFIAIAILVRVRPDMAPPGARLAWARRLPVVTGAWGVIVMVFVVSGGIYGGVFTVLEAAAVGCIFAILFTWYRGQLNWPTVRRVLGQTAATTGFIYIIIFGANIFSAFITITQLPETLAGGIHGAVPAVGDVHHPGRHLRYRRCDDHYPAGRLPADDRSRLQSDLVGGDQHHGHRDRSDDAADRHHSIRAARDETRHSAADDLLRHRAVFRRGPHTARHCRLVPGIGPLAARSFGNVDIVTEGKR